MTRPANDGCGEDSYVSHAVIKRNFGGSTPQVTGKLLKSENGLFRKKTNGTFGVLDIFTKHLCEKKNFVPRS